MTVFDFMEKTTKITFLPSPFFIEIIVVKPKVNVHSKIQSLFNAFQTKMCFSKLHYSVRKPNFPGQKTRFPTKS